MNAVCANPATTLARRLAAIVNAKTQDDHARSIGYAAAAANLREDVGQVDNTPDTITRNQNAAALLDDWATQLYRKVGP